MKKYVIFGFISFLTLSLFSCKSKEAETSVSSEKYFGEKTDETGAISYDSLLVAMIGVDSVEAKVTGLVSSVCQAKGCWMDITSEQNKEAETMFVEFKDYGFFMPKDLAGKKVVMTGKAFREVTSVEELKHFAEDEGLTPAEIEKITEPKEELKFLASGVMILD